MVRKIDLQGIQFAECPRCGAWVSPGIASSAHMDWLIVRVRHSIFSPPMPLAQAPVGHTFTLCPGACTTGEAFTVVETIGGYNLVWEHWKYGWGNTNDFLSWVTGKFMAVSVLATTSWAEVTTGTVLAFPVTGAGNPVSIPTQQIISHTEHQVRLDLWQEVLEWTGPTSYSDIRSPQLVIRCPVCGAELLRATFCPHDPRECVDEYISMVLSGVVQP
jgi:hypothetical protein